MAEDKPKKKSAADRVREYANAAAGVMKKAKAKPKPKPQVGAVRG